MIKPFAATSVAPIAAALCLANPFAAIAEGCKREPAAQWPVRIERGLPMVDGAINGTKVNVLVDTGAYATLIGNAAAERLKLYVDYRTTEKLKGGYQVGVATLDELRIGDTAVKGQSVRVAGDLSAGVDLILGMDFIRTFDLELDLPGGFIRAFHPARCPGESLAYWDAKAFEVGLEKSRTIRFPMSVNGRRGTAMLFSGTGVTVVSQSFGEKIGIKPGGPGVLPAGCTAAGKPMWIAKFDTFAIGDRAVADARIDVWPIQEAVDVYLGSDFLKTHRVLVSHSRGTMYFTDAGGLPFTAIPRLPCDEKMTGKSRKEILEHLDATLTREPRDPGALLRRAAMLRLEQPKKALIDFDAAIALEPSNPVAFSLRGEAHYTLKDYRAALPDLDSAISLGFVSAEIYTVRGQVRRKLADYARAIEDYDQAIRINPRYPAPLQSRGRFLYHAGRYEEAERDFTALLAVSPRWANAVWLSMARGRRGLDSRTILEAARARLKDEEWPVPILDYLLGRIDLEAVMAKAGVADQKVRGEQECEARYYAAARLLVDGKAAAARPLLVQASDECRGESLERESAALELKGLN